MKYQAHMIWELGPEDSIVACRHSDAVSLSSLTVQPEFTIRFMPEHLPELRELIRHLEFVSEKETE